VSGVGSRLSSAVVIGFVVVVHGRCRRSLRVEAENERGPVVSELGSYHRHEQAVSAPLLLPVGKIDHHHGHTGQGTLVDHAGLVLVGLGVCNARQFAACSTLVAFASCRQDEHHSCLLLKAVRPW